MQREGNSQKRSNQFTDSEASWGKLVSLLRKTGIKYREIGLVRTIQVIFMNIRVLVEDYISERYDRRHGIKTAGIVNAQDLTIESPNKHFAIRYQPTTERRLLAMFSALPRDRSSFTFVDFGSGRGRVILFASHFNFKRIVGVEFSEELHRSAIDNISIVGRKKPSCANVESHHQDATRFEIPDGPLVLYFFDPFRDHVMQDVLDNVKRSYLNDPRKIYLMYLAPVHAAMVEATGIFHRMETPELPHEFSLQNQYRFSLYETVQSNML